MLTVGTVVGGYRVEGLIGVGGMGIVYEATQLSLDRRVALKALRPELALDATFVARFRREGRLQASFHHAHAIEVYEAIEDPAGLFLSMRLERGPTLGELLAAGQVDAAAALRVLGQVAEALDAAHAAGLVHRDVKPANVLVAAGGDAYLSDFGLTKAGDGTELTATGGMLGTLSYLAPEVVRGEAATPASDRYALAAVAFECLCGAVPFPRRSPAAVLYAQANEPAPVPSDRRPELPAEVDARLSEGLAKAPADRPRTAAALVMGLREALRGVDLGPPPASVPETVEGGPGVTAPPTRHRPRAAAIAVTALLVGVGAGAVVAGIADEGIDEAKVATVPVPQPGRTVDPLGSVLGAAGRTVDCRGEAVGAASPACSVAQVRLGGRHTVIPSDGAILGWAVRGARGELALQVLRRDASGASQVARTQYEQVNNGSPQRFAANLDVQRGDFIALEVTRGSGFGLGRREGATTERWFPTRRGKPRLPADKGPGTGVDGELLVRADFVPGGKRRDPQVLTGAAAADAPPGRRVARRTLTFADGRRVGLEVVEVGDVVVLDLIRGGRRVARAGLPDFLPGGRVITVSPLSYDDSEAAGEVGVEWVNENSARVREHYYGVYPRNVEFYD